MEAVAQHDVISELLDKSFAARAVCEQKDILQHKKPLPRLRVKILIQQDWQSQNPGRIQ